MLLDRGAFESAIVDFLFFFVCVIVLPEVMLLSSRATSPGHVQVKKNDMAYSVWTIFNIYIFATDVCVDGM